MALCGAYVGAIVRWRDLAQICSDTIGAASLKSDSQERDPMELVGSMHEAVEQG